MSSIQNSMLLGFRDSWPWETQCQLEIFRAELNSYGLNKKSLTKNRLQPQTFYKRHSRKSKKSWSKSTNLTCKSKGVTRASLSSTVHMGLPLPSASLGSMIFPDVSPPVRLLSLWRNRDELNTCSTRFVDFWESRLAVLPDGSAWKGKQAKHRFYIWQYLL